MSRSSLSLLAALALSLGGGLTWWSLSRLRTPSAAGPTARADEAGRIAGAPALVTPAESTGPTPPPPLEEQVAPPEQAVSRVAVRSPVAAVEPPWSAPLDVVVLDARTGVGLPFARVRAKEEQRMAFSAEVDRTGLARLSRSFGAASLKLTLYDGLTGLRHETTVLHGSPPGGGSPPAFEWAIDVGPTYGLAVDTRSLPEGEDSLAAMLCEVGPGGEIRTWSSQDVSGEREGLLWLRYPEVEHEPAPGWRAFLHLWAPGTFFSGDVRVPGTIGLHEHLTVVLEASAGGFRGRVTDAEGRPVEAQVVVLGGSPVRLAFGGSDGAWLELETDEEGRFEAAPVAPGKHAVIVRSNQRPVARAEVTITAGAMTERSFVVGSHVRGALTGDVRGALVSRPGAGEPLGVLELDSVDKGGVSRVTSTAWELFGKDPDGEERSAYEFTGLPKGRYRVRVVALDGRTYAPSEQVVEVPAVGVDFATAQSLEQATVAHRIEVTDSGTGAPINRVAALLRLGSYWIGQEIDEVPTDFEGPREVDAELVVGATGYVPARIGVGDYDLVGDTRLYRIGLRRGHGAALVVVDAEEDSVGLEEDFGEVFPARGVPGAQVLVDGHAHPVGPDGLALIEAGAPIESLHVEAPGWEMLAVKGFEGHASTHGLNFVLMVRE